MIKFCQINISDWVSHIAYIHKLMNFTLNPFTQYTNPGKTKSKENLHTC